MSIFAQFLCGAGNHRDGNGSEKVGWELARTPPFGEPLLVPGETLLVETFATGDNPDTDTGRSPIKGAFSYMVTWQLALREDATGEANITPASGAGGDLDTLALIGVDEPTVGSDLAFA